MNLFKRILTEIKNYPSAIAGVIIIAGLIGISIYTVFAIPYGEAIRLWRGGVGVWDENPRNASPAWINWFRSDDLPETTVLRTDDGSAIKTITPTTDGSQIYMEFDIEYPYVGFPQELAVYFTSEFEAKNPLIGMTWVTPDGREVNAGTAQLGPTFTWYASQDSRLARRLRVDLPLEGLFMTPDSDPKVALAGTYKLKIEAFTFEPASDVEARLVLFGQVHGIAGTDHLRRDLMIALLWGTPIALSFGLLAAFGTTLTTMIIAAVGTWYGGWVDGLIQRITEVNLVLPFLSILIMVGTFYSTSIWLMLGITILLSIFGAAIKNYRSIFLQVKESPYVEAARSYGASDSRIILRYLVPRIIPLIIPSLVTLIPSYVFLEASLAVLGLGDPTLPTWGKIINDAQGNGALYQGYYYWVLQPAVILMVTGLAFSLVGFALDRIFNPRLRGV